MKSNLALILCGFLAACSAQPSDIQRTWIQDLELKVVLPPGAGKLACYERHYTSIKLSELAGQPIRKDRLLIEGVFVLGGRPGTHWAKKVSDLPKAFDAGCSAITVTYDTTTHQLFSPAECSTTVAGVSPKAVEPPVTC